MQGFSTDRRHYNKMVADMQRLDQVLREVTTGVENSEREEQRAGILEAKRLKDPEP